MDFISIPLSDLTLVPDNYSPSVDEHGNYYDKMPNWNNRGFYCPCGSRREKLLYDTSTKLASHIKCKRHKEWVTELNVNKTNYFQKNQELQKTIQNQQLIIAKMQKDLEKKQHQINYLLDQLSSSQTKMSSSECSMDLLNFD